MIRNYFTDAFKTGVAVTTSDTLLIDGRVKALTPQSDWQQYVLYVGEAPGLVPITATAHAVVTNTAVVTFSPPNPNIKVGMSVGGAAGLSNQTVSTVDSPTQITLSANIGAAIPEGTVLTFSYTAINTLKVTTINDDEVIFTNIQPGFVLPLSVVQVHSTGTGGGVASMIALS